LIGIDDIGLRIEKVDAEK